MKLLGKGAFGAVFLYSYRDRPEQKVAIKIIHKSNFPELQMQLMKDEVNIMA